MSMTADAGIHLTDEIRFLPGVGPGRAVHLQKMGVTRVRDLLEYFPLRHERHESRTVEDLEEGIIATIVGRIMTVRSRFGRRGRSVSATLTDNTGRCSLCWFNAPWMVERLRRGMIIRATGRVTEYRESPQLVNPRVTVLDDDARPIDGSEPAGVKGVYPAIAAISSRAIEQIISANLDRMLQLVEEPYSRGFMEARRLGLRRWALRVMHRPTGEEELQNARRRLAYDELLLLQLATGLMRHHRARHATASSLKCTDVIDRHIRRRFPFSLTSAQEKAALMIASDLARPRPMNRLLQGDVGCGKTVVALYAALVTIANKAQVAIMAPTEILAEQHARSVAGYLRGSRVRHELLVGGLPARPRREILGAIESGTVDLVIGTHALLQRDVRFAKLGLVVIDEQHRFGVRQRASIRSKGLSPHYLVMTATPIPRTLAMTVFGDLDVTTIDELPPGRRSVRTEVVDPLGYDRAWDRVREGLLRGEQVYVVYPIIDASDAMELRAATTEYERLRDTRFADHRVGLLHGRMSGAERQTVMGDFVEGRIRLLVSTTVVEVGIDVPNATCMVIEHAERYGLSQLHQLRGRIGRGAACGRCFLMTHSTAAIDNERLQVLAATTDGFKIAEEDLRLRGPGEMLGTRQHGLPDLRVADLVRDGALLRMAQRDAADLLRDDPQLRHPERAVLRRELLAQYEDRPGFLDVG